MGTVSQYTSRSNDDRHQRRDRLVLALHLVCTAVGACGMRLVYLLLQITGLKRFVGASYGTQQQLNRRVDEAIVAYRREERARLAHKMPARAITLQYRGRGQRTILLGLILQQNTLC